ncbi:cyclic-di-AMP receptor [Brevibacillus dissolubilis]|uniref:cyclic-di-AMP receptor n=1 Tax=Brevibacillus dissolubilis TaxID=1844116 RepID=UPI0011160A42|nr:cyclic-di-AMP receptor [Brevibacillus dissolubilis]
MKMVIAVVQDKDSARLSQKLVQNGYRATKLASTGGFLRAGNTTFLIGTDDERVPDVIQIIEQNCQSRNQMVTPVSPLGSGVDSFLSYPLEVQVGGAAVFVMDVEQFHSF